MLDDPNAIDIIRPNAKDENGDYWDPWEALGLDCMSYNSEIDTAAINVLKGIASEKRYTTDIASKYKIDPLLVEFLQSIFSGSNWCEYGTSPRGCWPIDRDGFHLIIEAWEAYYERHWGEALGEDHGG